MPQISWKSTLTSPLEIHVPLIVLYPILLPPEQDAERMPMLRHVRVHEPINMHQEVKVFGCRVHVRILSEQLLGDGRVVPMELRIFHFRELITGQ
jgi:hypothetical protein